MNKTKNKSESELSELKINSLFSERSEPSLAAPRQMNSPKARQSKRLIGIYTAEGIVGTSLIRVKHLDNVTEDVAIRDTQIKAYSLTPDVLAVIYACNITNIFLEKSKELPMMYVNVSLNKYLQTFPLYQLYLTFSITSDIKSERELLNKRHKGKYIMYAVVENKKVVIDAEINKFDGPGAIIDKLIEFTKKKEMMSLVDEFVNDIKTDLAKKYSGTLSNFKIPENVISIRNRKNRNKDYSNKK